MSDTALRQIALATAAPRYDRSRAWCRAATAPLFVVAGLTNSSTSLFQVAATAAGTGLTSVVVPATVPGAPMIGTAASAAPADGDVAGHRAAGRLRAPRLAIRNVPARADYP